MTPAQHLARGFRIYFVVRYWLRWVWHRLTCACGVSWVAYRQENWPRYALAVVHFMEHCAEYAVAHNGEDPEKASQAVTELIRALSKYKPNLILIP